jgi:hypothetical protein
MPAAENAIPTRASDLNGGTFSFSVSAWVAAIATFDDNVFYSSKPALLYTLTIGLTPASGLVVDFVQGAPTGFPLAIDQTPSQIEGSVLSALTGGWTGDLSVLTGTLDVSGHDNASVGFSYAFDVSMPSTVPEPSSALLVGFGALAGLGVWERRRRAARA